MRKNLSVVLILILIMLMPVTVWADDYEEENLENVNEIIETVGAVTEEPKINSRSALVLERSTKRVLYEKNAYTKYPMASTTKIMTAIIVLENADLTKIVEISKKAAGTGGSVVGFRAGDKITIHDLLYGLMIKSRK